MELMVLVGATQHTKPILVKLDTEQILQALTSEDTVKYIEKLAQEFAAKAAEHFLDQIRTKKRELATGYKLHSNVNEIRDRSHKYNRILGENEALALIDEPPPDGDNLGFSQLTDTEVQVKKPIPVIGLTKVNGRYYYRRLGLI
ncbi:uncharacterized protein [Epargyreus clarus]|uniref:uncharacterized protein n=1 Tax=Epargyreus clarus TaxID=520877 RepID=UPI003C2F2ABC